MTLAFGYAYALTRTTMSGKGFFRAVAMLPLYAPTMALGIGLVYLFGNKGLVTTGFLGLGEGLLGRPVDWNIGLYGPIGIILGEVLYCFPQALVILAVAASLADARLYEASQALGASPWHTFWNVTLPNLRYGLISTIFICFTLAFTDALKQLDAEFEAVSASLRVPFYRTFWRITLPLCLSAVLEIAIYYFVNAMVTVSAVIFLYSPNLRLAAVAIVNMDDAGDTATAAAMSALVILTSVDMRLLYEVAARQLYRRTQRWKTRE